MQQVLDFWFKQITPKQWFGKDSDFDKLLAKKFYPLLEQAAAGELWHWRAKPEGRLAEIILLDQIPRNIYRDTAASFAFDGMALVLAQEALHNNALANLPDADQRSFLLMPFMHSESKPIHQMAVTLFAQYASPTGYDYELKHKAIIDRFGRYPHRNAILKRESSKDELDFLAQPGSRF